MLEDEDSMDNVYINELIEKIKLAEIWKATSERAKNYNDGMLCRFF